MQVSAKVFNVVSISSKKQTSVKDTNGGKGTEGSNLHFLYFSDTCADGVKCNKRFSRTFVRVSAVRKKTFGRKTVGKKQAQISA